MSELTHQIAQFTVATRYDDLSPRSLQAARHGVLDCLGVSIAGAQEPIAAMAAKTFARGGEASLFGIDGKASMHDAAMINGVIAHALDYDDAMFWGHPTPPILPAVLSVAEARGIPSTAVLTAYVAGVEAATLVGRQIMETHYAKGFHSTGTIGTLGAAAAVSRLLELDVQQTAHALGLAGGQAAGLKCASGTMAKPLNAGKAAANGVIAALLAESGFSGPRNVLEAEQGFFFAQADYAASDIGPATFGTMICENRFKFQAACYLVHSAISAVTSLRNSHDISAEDVESVEVEVAEVALSICNIQEPADGLECKFSLRHCVAFALLGYDTGAIATFSDENAVKSELVRLRRRVRILSHPGMDTRAKVVVTLQNGQRFMIEADVNANRHEDAEQESMLLSKFLNLVRPVLGERADALGKRILQLGANEGSIAELMAATRPS